MTTALIVLAFVLMLAAPCIVALRTSRRWDLAEPVEREIEEDEPAAVAEMAAAREAPVVTLPARFPTLGEMAEDAAEEARRAADLAQEMHWAALAAQAKATRLRADALAEVAEEANHVAEQAMRVARAEAKARTRRRAA